MQKVLLLFVSILSAHFNPPASLLHAHWGVAGLEGPMACGTFYHPFHTSQLLNPSTHDVYHTTLVHMLPNIKQTTQPESGDMKPGVFLQPLLKAQV